MSFEDTISPSSESYVAERACDDTMDAIILWEVPLEERADTFLSRESKLRRKSPSESMATNEATWEKRFDDYRALSSDFRNGEPLSISKIGDGILPLAKAEVTGEMLGALAHLPNVVAVLPNQDIGFIHPSDEDFGRLASNEAEAGLTWGLKQLDIPEMWKTTRGEHVTVAVLDTGVNAEHPALAGRVREFVVIDPIGRRITTNKPFDTQRHGTHVCGTIAGGNTAGGVTIGMAPEAGLLAVCLQTGRASLVSLIEGISWAVERHADIINMSLALTRNEPRLSLVLELLIDGYNIVPVVAVGNQGYGHCACPGSTADVLSVGSVEKTSPDETRVSDYSGGATFTLFCPEGIKYVTKPDVVAPGTQVWSCIPPEKHLGGVPGTHWYSYMSGTSMATAHVSGVLALLMSAVPGASARNVVNAVNETAKHPNGAHLRPCNQWGWGLIQPAEALRALR